MAGTEPGHIHVILKDQLVPVVEVAMPLGGSRRGFCSTLATLLMRAITPERLGFAGEMQALV
jgi:hypothetical protein